MLESNPANKKWQLREKPKQISYISESRLNFLRERFNRRTFTVSDAYEALLEIEKSRSFLVDEQAIRAFLSRMVDMGRIKVMTNHERNSENRAQKIYQVI